MCGGAVRWRLGNLWNKHVYYVYAVRPRWWRNGCGMCGTEGDAEGQAQQMTTTVHDGDGVARVRKARLFYARLGRYTYVIRRTRQMSGEWRGKTRYLSNFLFYFFALRVRVSWASGPGRTRRWHHRCRRRARPRHTGGALFSGRSRHDNAFYYIRARPYKTITCSACLRVQYE